MPVTAQKNLTISVTAISTAVSTSTPWVPLDIHETPFNVGFGVVKSVSGGVTFKIEHTFDDVFDPNASPVAFTHADVTDASGNIDGNYAFGIRACRLTVVSACASSNLSLRVVQAGNIKL